MGTKFPHFQVVIPSRKRPENVKQMLGFFPTALFCVEDSEVDAYRQGGCPEENLILHPPLPWLGRIRNWIWDNVPDEVIIQIDDDLEYFRCHVGKRHRIIKESEALNRIIENTMVCANDLGLSTFGWSHLGRPEFYTPHDPIKFNHSIARAWGTIGRKFRCDDRLSNIEDDDFTLQVLLKERIAYVDYRFYVSFGKVGIGEGGCRGSQTGAEMQRCERLMKKKWGKYYVASKPPGVMMPQTTNKQHGINVRRKM